jgi:hypothetical protein
MVLVARLVLGGLVRGLSLAIAVVTTVIVGARQITVLARTAMLSMARVRNCNLRHAAPTCAKSLASDGIRRSLFPRQSSSKLLGVNVVKTRNQGICQSFVSSVLFNASYDR